MYKTTKNSLILGILLSTFLLMAVQPSQALLLQSNLLSGTPPTIDGVAPAGEWAEAYTNFIPCFESADPDIILWVTLKAMNTGQNLYLLVQWYDCTHDSDEDSLFLFFDEDGDDNFAEPAQSENALEVEIEFNGVTTTQYRDLYGQNLIAADQNGTHGEADATWTPCIYTVEIRVPLNSMDQEDLQVVAGDVVGLAIIIKNKPAGDVYEFPYDTYTDLKKTTNPFQLAGPSAIGTPTIYLILLTIGLLSLLIIWKNHTPYRQLSSRRDT